MTAEEKDSQFIAAMISREIAERLIDQCIGAVSDSILYEFKGCLSRSNYFIYKAQHYDLNLLTVANLKEFDNYENFLPAYINRCYFGSGIFLGNAH
ncbi:MAG: hypothetical protein IPN95_27970 [Bacteroidetes bacterium]|nr:hypothetical protein [Bacteroidota bacterium]